MGLLLEIFTITLLLAVFHIYLMLTKGYIICLLISQIRRVSRKFSKITFKYCFVWEKNNKKNIIILNHLETQLCMAKSSWHKLHGSIARVKHRGIWFCTTLTIDAVFLVTKSNKAELTSMATGLRISKGRQPFLQIINTRTASKFQKRKKK